MSKESDSDSGTAVAGLSLSGKTSDTGNELNSNSSMLSPPPKKIAKRQTFRTAWLQDPNFASWLQKCENPFKAKCTACNTIFTAGKGSLLKHVKTVVHGINIQNRRLEGEGTAEDSAASFESNTTKTELQFCIDIVQHSPSFNLFRHFVGMVEMTRKKVIVDCDAGIDDALALIILIAAHKQKQIEIKGITCVNGNTTVDNVVKNVYRTLNVCNATHIPVFQGAYAPLVCTEITDKVAQMQYHGRDGFGDVYDTEVDTSKLQKEHAVHALNRIVSENPDEMTILCLGPLTNIALAIKMYPEFAGNVQEFYVMGGNSTAQGNATSQAEFNFYVDPESVHIVFKSSQKPLWLLPWETCLKSRISTEWRKNVLGQMDNPCMKLMNEIERGCQKNKKEEPNYVMCDAILGGILLRPDIAENVVKYHADIELSGNKTRGQVVLDHLLSNEPNVHLIQEFNSELFKNLLKRSADIYFNDINI